MSRVRRSFDVSIMSSMLKWGGGGGTRRDFRTHLPQAPHCGRIEQMESSISRLKRLASVAQPFRRGIELRSIYRKSLTRFAPKMRNTAAPHSDSIRGADGAPNHLQCCIASIG